MAYVIPIVLGAVGMFILYKGSTLFLDHSSALARYWRVPLIIIGLTIVALGTSLPELVVGIIAGLEQKNDIVLGNVLGSNVANIGIVLGLSILIYPINLGLAKKSRLELFGLLCSIGLLYLMVIDGYLSRVDGVILVACGVGFTWIAVRYHSQNNGIERDDIATNIAIRQRKDLVVSVAALLAGLALLFVGARMVVTNAIVLARLFQLSELFIGITIVAVGTSLPEIVTGITASLRKSNDLVIGNVVGSNILNILIVLGVTICIAPITVAASFWKFDLPLVLLLTLLLAGLMYRGQRLSKGFGVMFLSAYGLYVLIAFLVEQGILNSFPLR
ncbi:MAG: calcium/sodium antiporter [Patescibacteria group bacterium]